VDRGHVSLCSNAAQQIKPFNADDYFDDVCYDPKVLHFHVVIKS
jgi:hypothetical protein